MKDVCLKFAIGCFIAAVLIMLCLLGAGCETFPRHYNTVVDGAASIEGLAAREGMSAVATPIVGADWGTILGSLAGLITGGYAVYKRKKWIDQDPPKGGT